MTTKLSLLRVFADNSAAANSEPDTKDGVMYLNATLLYHRARWFFNTLSRNPLVFDKIPSTSYANARFCRFDSCRSHNNLSHANEEV